MLGSPFDDWSPWPWRKEGVVNVTAVSKMAVAFTIVIPFESMRANGRHQPQRDHDPVRCRLHAVLGRRAARNRLSAPFINVVDRPCRIEFVKNECVLRAQTNSVLGHEFHERRALNQADALVFCSLDCFW